MKSTIQENNVLQRGLDAGSDKLVNALPNKDAQPVHRKQRGEHGHDVAAYDKNLGLDGEAFELRHAEG